MMNRRGVEMTVGSIVYFILGAFLMIIIIPFLSKESNVILANTQPLTYHQQYMSCVGFGVKQNEQCKITDDDKDGDCAPDKCDFCILAEKGAGSTGDKLRQARGSNQCDYDKDGMPDACDVDPWNSKDSYCQRDMKGKCKESQGAIQNMPPCKIPAFVLTPTPP